MIKIKSFVVKGKRVSETMGGKRKSDGEKL